MQWNVLKNKKPEGEFTHVLVSQDHYGDQAYTEYFVAKYCPLEKEWISFFCYDCARDGAAHTINVIPASESDIWAYIPSIPDSFIEENL